MRDLSIIIPARNEEFINLTVENILKKRKADTEVIVIFDGLWPAVPLKQDDRVNVIYHPKSVGQRAAINDGVRMSRAKYIMKLDAHCTLDIGFDEKLIAGAKELGREVTQVPKQFNLHAFDWICEDDHRRYQGPSGPCSNCLNCKRVINRNDETSGRCECEHPKACGKPTKKDIMFKPRWNRVTTRWRFDRKLHFQYWGTKETGPYIETMSLLGACWFLDREWYWELGGSDEEHGSWGQQGTEIACKSWLSGGKVITNTNTWFSHLFRTQGGDFGFPYKQSNRQVDHARKYSQDLWIKGKWPGQKRPLLWLLKHFWPVPDWTDGDLKNMLK